MSKIGDYNLSEFEQSESGKMLAKRAALLSTLISCVFDQEIIDADKKSSIAAMVKSTMEKPCIIINQDELLSLVQTVIDKSAYHIECPVCVGDHVYVLEEDGSTVECEIKIVRHVQNSRDTKPFFEAYIKSLDNTKLHGYKDPTHPEETGIWVTKSMFGNKWFIAKSNASKASEIFGKK